MPNGVSCAYFAAKNLEVGIKEKNVFRGGIAGIQTARTADAAAQTFCKTGAAITKSTVFSGVKNVLGKVAVIAKKLLYPLIICSGIYSTVKSDDKVKTGISQATGIGLMYGMEQLAEKTFIKQIESKVSATNNKKLKIGWYILRGLAYATCSLAGYDIGNKVAGKTVDKIREHKNKNNQNKSSESIVPENSKSSEEIEKIIFGDIEDFSQPTEELQES